MHTFVFSTWEISELGTKVLIRDSTSNAAGRSLLDPSWNVRKKFKKQTWMEIQAKHSRGTLVLPFHQPSLMRLWEFEQFWSMTRYHREAAKKIVAATLSIVEVALARVLWRWAEWGFE
mmetsp:Transcript_48877/g.96709  ORF Transcript_48877/g.96709 Transcript_48877/m.96709 type:complete len:118 (-) Transcript_48877:998-1351(-)